LGKQKAESRKQKLEGEKLKAERGRGEKQKVESGRGKQKAE
jgi:hypothetical protein